ncbi:hypothetical protein HDV05_006455 [Chytridiales sp. JEL 0842]|nr:hypothetical protein HDV05_006455 [Chytridiales sp. JEL 0842]
MIARLGLIQARSRVSPRLCPSSATVSGGTIASTSLRRLNTLRCPTNRVFGRRRHDLATTTTTTIVSASATRALNHHQLNHQHFQQLAFFSSTLSSRNAPPSVAADALKSTPPPPPPPSSSASDATSTAPLKSPIISAPAPTIKPETTVEKVLREVKEENEEEQKKVVEQQLQQQQQQQQVVEGKGPEQGGDDKTTPLAAPVAGVDSSSAPSAPSTSASTTAAASGAPEAATPTATTTAAAGPGTQTTTDTTATATAVAAEPKKSLMVRIKEEAIHYWHGLKLLGVETKISYRLLVKLLRGQALNRREDRQLKRTIGDLFRLVPFIIILVIPFMELALPFLLALFPNMLPSTFESKFQEEEKKKKLLKVRLEMARFLQDTVADMAVSGSVRAQGAREFSDFFNNFRTSGAQAPTDEILKVAKKFGDELTLTNLSRPQLVSMAKYMNINAFGTDAFLRHQIENRLKYLKADDLLIAKEGIDSLTLPEIQQICQSRGIRTVGVSPARLKSELSQWLDLHLKYNIPSSLLILSRAFIISEKIPSSSTEALSGSAAALQEVLSSLPEQVVNEARLNVEERSGVASAKLKLHVLQEQEELIADELEQEAAQKAAKEQAIKVAAAAAAAAPTASPESVSTTPSPAAAKQVEETEMTISENQLKQLGEALRTMATDSALEDVKADLEGLKEDRKEYKEDIDELKQLTQKAPPKAADSVSDRLDKMISKIENELQKYDAQIGSKLNLIRPDERGRLSVSDLEEVLKVIRDNPGDERIKLIVKRLDSDGDGVVSIPELLGMIQGVSEKEGHGVVIPPATGAAVPPTVVATTAVSAEAPAAATPLPASGGSTTPPTSKDAADSASVSKDSKEVFASITETFHSTWKTYVQVTQELLSTFPAIVKDNNASDSNSAANAKESRLLSSLTSSTFNSSPFPSTAASHSSIRDSFSTLPPESSLGPPFVSPPWPLKKPVFTEPLLPRPTKINLDIPRSASFWTFAAAVGKDACGHKHPFSGSVFDGDIVFIPGFYGSHLHHRETGVKAWLPVEAVWNWVKTDLIQLPLSLVGKGGDTSGYDEFVPSSVMESLGPFNLCRNFIHEMKQLEACKEGKFRFHTFPYDWRRELQHSSEEFEKFIEAIYDKNGKKPVTVVAHSMGGLVTLGTVNRRPELFRGVIFEGTPFGGVPVILWALSRGAPLMVNPTLLGPALHFSCRWKEYTLASSMKSPQSQESLDQMTEYVKCSLSCAKDYLQSIQFKPDVKYPKFVVVRSDSWPTPSKFRTVVTERGSSPAFMESLSSFFSSSTSSFSTQTSVESNNETKDAENQESRPIMSVWLSRVQESFQHMVGFSADSASIPLSNNQDDVKDIPTETVVAPANQDEAVANSKLTVDAASVEDQPSKLPSTPAPIKTAITPDVTLDSEHFTDIPLSAEDDISAKPDTTTPINIDTPSIPPPPPTNDKQKDIYFQMPILFSNGDGIVSTESSNMPTGYTFDIVLTAASHPGMVNDLYSLREAFEKIEKD